MAMRRHFASMHLVLALGLLFGTAAACALQPLAGTPAARTFYFGTTADLRLCPSPTCGGYFVHALNRQYTRCADETRATSCHALWIDWSALSIDAAAQAALEEDAASGRAIIRGYLIPGPDIPDTSTLVALRAWRSATAALPAGRYFRLRDLGIACIQGFEGDFAAPCFSLSARLINRPRRTDISALDLEAAGATAAQIDAAYRALSRGRLIVAGRIRSDPSTEPPGETLHGAQFYLPVPRAGKTAN